MSGLLSKLRGRAPLKRALDVFKIALKVGTYKMKTELHQATAEGSLNGALRKKMNLALVRVAQLDLKDKRPEEISLGDVVGNLDAWGFLILCVSLVATLICGTLSGMLFLMIWPKPDPSILVYLGAVPGVLAGFLICYFLFRIKRWLR